MHPVTTARSFVLELPETAERIDSSPTAIGSDERWRTPDGLYVALSVVPAPQDPELDSLGLDASIGSTLARYRRSFAGTVHALFGLDVRGATAARVGRVSLTNIVGEPTELILVAALSEDREVATLQIAWPTALSESLAPEAGAVAKGFSLA